METKMLHERLRDHAAAPPGKKDLRINGNNHSELLKKEASDLAAEIERFYVPLPCDDDGNPWRLMDACTYLGKPYEVAGFDGKGFVYLYDDYSDIYIWANVTDVKRRAEVLDADGVPINIGDTVFEGDSPIPLKVIHIYEYGDIQAVGDGDLCSKLDSSNYTHERPVIDAEGERIKKGDVVWDVDSGEKLTVQEFANRECGLVQCRNEETWNCEDYDAHGLTHKEPDSLEKLRDDVARTLDQSEAVFPCGREGLEEIRDRLTALMERGAK